MKKNSITLLLIIFMSMIGIYASAHDIAVANSDGVTIYYKWANTGLSVSYRGSSYDNYSNEYTGNVVIPESVTYNGKTYSVTSIGNYAFRGCKALTSVTIPNSVTSIGGSAFSSCSGLTSVTIPNSVTSIGDFAFSGCSSLTEVYFNAISCTSMGSYFYPVFSGCSSLVSLTIGENVQGIPSDAFRGCSGLTSVSIGNSVTSIGDGAFSSCSGLTSVTIPNSVTSIGGSAFSGCSGLASVSIGNSVTSIGDGAFSSCSGLASVTIGNSVTSIGDFAFSGCSSLASVTIGNSVTSIGYEAFSGCSSLASVTIGNSVTSIGYEAFRDCSSLTSVTIPNSVTSIGTSAFYNCSSLTSVTIPNSVTSIGKFAFYGCTGLQSVVIGNGITNLPDYAFGTGNSLKSLTIGTGVLTISSNAFNSPSEKKPIKTIWLTNTPPTNYSYAAGTVNYVANNLYTALSNKTEYKFLSSLFEVDGVKYVPVSPSDRTCDAIDCRYDAAAENIHIGKTVTNQGVTLTVMQVQPYAFYGNPHVEDADLSFNGNIGDYAFYGCNNINKAVIKNVGSIGNNSFSNCIALETATLGEEITSLGEYAFSGCSSLKGIIIPNAVKTIWQYAFQNCSAMETVKMGTGVTSIAQCTFSGCSSLTDMQIGSNVETIGTYAFSGCKSLPTIRIPRAVTNINNYVFYNCNRLNTVIMEDRKSVLKLGSNGSSPLFSDCPLDSVYIGGDISYSTNSNYGYSPFYRNTSLRTVVITDKETEISTNEFYGCTNLQDVKIGDGVESFGSWAFSGCSSLRNFSFGMNVETIGKEAFSDCTAMERIYSRSPQPPVCGSQALDDINKWNCVLTVPAGNVAAYQNAEQWKEFFFIEEGDPVNKYITITIEKSEGGKVLVNGKDTPEQVKKGSDVKLQFIPDTGYRLTQVLVNDEDVTAQVTDGKYTVTGASVDLTVKVTFGVNQYMLTYLVDGEEYWTLQMDYGEAITPEPAPEKEGYTFSGWKGLPATMPAHDVTVTGSFSINSYTLTYMIGDVVYKQVMYEYGAAITPEPQPEGDYLTFEWVGVPETMPAHDVVVTAVYETGIAELMMLVQQGQVRIYSPNGKRLDRLQKGLNIVVMEDGTTRKVVVR